MTGQTQQNGSRVNTADSHSNQVAHYRTHTKKQDTFTFNDSTNIFHIHNKIKFPMKNQKKNHDNRALQTTSTREHTCITHHPKSLQRHFHSSQTTREKMTGQTQQNGSRVNTADSHNNKVTHIGTHTQQQETFTFNDSTHIFTTKTGIPRNKSK